MGKKSSPQVYRGVDLTPVLSVIDCLDEGMIDREVAEKTGIPMLSIHGVRRTLGIPANRQHVASRKRRAAARAMHKTGMSIDDIAGVLKTKVQTIEKWLEHEDG